MLGLKWRAADRRDGSNCTSVFIEMKYGINAYHGKSGIAEHLVDLDGILGNPAKKAALDLTIAGQFAQLYQLDLLRFNPSKAFDGVTVSGRPEVILLLANNNPRSRKLLDVLRSITEPEHFELRFFVASFAGYGLHDACMLPLQDFIKYLERYPT